MPRATGLTQTPSPTRTLPFEGKVSIAGCLYLAAALTYQTLKFFGAPGGLPWGLLGVIPFVLVFLLAALGVWKKPRAGFITAVAICAVSLLLVGPNLNIAQAPSVESVLVGGASFDGALFLTLFFSLFGARGAWSKSAPAKAQSFRLGRKAGIVALVLLLIFISAGAAYGSTQTAGPANTGQADVIISVGSGYLTSSQFYVPQSFQAHVGQTVIWKNLDNIPHTVTSSTGLFMSGSMNPGASYSYTFNHAGTYYYTCDYHSWMAGSIVVSS
jgi:plastocyanin